MKYRDQRKIEITDGMGLELLEGIEADIGITIRTKYARRKHQYTECFLDSIKLPKKKAILDLKLIEYES